VLQRTPRSKHVEDTRLPNVARARVAALGSQLPAVDRDMDVGKARRQRAPIDPPLLALVRRLVGRAALLLLNSAARSASKVSMPYGASCI
jgi:hypothetical protein